MSSKIATCPNSELRRLAAGAWRRAKCWLNSNRLVASGTRSKALCKSGKKLMPYQLSQSAAVKFSLFGRVVKTLRLWSVNSPRAPMSYTPSQNYIVSAHAVPNDQRFSELWGMRNTGQNIQGTAGLSGADIGAVPAWDIATDSRTVVVGIIDTGIDYNHPDLAANIWAAPTAFTVNIAGQIIRCEAGTHGFNAVTKTLRPGWMTTTTALMSPEQLAPWAITGKASQE
ncbi:MAG: S8 family serine peptidase [Pyrinomonadaceae bacterium]